MTTDQTRYGRTRKMTAPETIHAIVGKDHGVWDTVGVPGITHEYVLATRKNAEIERLENSITLADHLWTAKQARLTRMDLRLEAARAALTEIAAISGGPIRRIALGALDKMETD